MNIAGLMDLQSTLRPGKIAFHFRDKEYSYQYTNQMINRVATALSQLGVRKGDRVSLWLPNSIEFVWTFYAVLKLGAIVVPMNILFKEGEVTHILSNSGARVLVTTLDCKEIVQTISDKIPSLEHVIFTGCHENPPVAPNVRTHCWSFIEEQEDGHMLMDLSPDDIAAILYTSGTTGKPKGVMLSHANLLLNAEYYAYNIGLTDTYVGCIVTPMSHLLVLMAGVLMIPLKGAECYIFERFDAELVARAIVEKQINYFIGVPSMYYMFLGLPLRPEFDMSCLKICITSGAQMPLEVRRRFEERYQTTTIQAYGQTETSPCISTDSVHKERRFESVGYPLPGLKVRIVDDEGKDVPVGSPGEIIVTGHCVMKGYWNNPKVTLETIRDGWLYTGDIGKLDEDGYLYLLDRKKDVIISGGYNIYPVEVENVLYQHPAVLEAAVIRKPDERLGEIPAAYVVVKQGQSVSDDELKEHCRRMLAIYKCPREITFIDEIPKGPTGKLLKRKLEVQG